MAESCDSRLPASAIEAKKVLQSLRLDHGFLGARHEEVLSHIELETQEAVKRLAETARRRTAKYTNSIAGELYSSKFRFIYELLQNADDSVYTGVRDAPCVTMSLFRHKFVLETNETGFTIANVKAICNTGESSKKQSDEDGSIGEKGYGFKSVFAVAHTARIQSGFWSFRFEHHEGDDGMGMITPIDIDPEALPEGITTRIELVLKHESDIFEQISEELRSLHETTIFFLQKVTKLVINIHNDGGSHICTEVQTETLNDDQAVLDRAISLTRNVTTNQCNGPAATMTHIKCYHVLEHVMSGMPIDKHRTNRTSSTLKLAFPFEAVTRSPLIDADGEHVFAYLPLYRKSNLPFLIQGDFVTTTSRESVLPCLWNNRLRLGVAEAFSKAVQRFYHDDVLRYRWLKYVPVLPIHGFEINIFNLIKRELEEVAVLQTWTSRRVAQLSGVKIVNTTFKHDEEPLFADLEEEIYLAKEYHPDDHPVLRALGVQTMTHREELERLIHDLGRLSSKVRTTGPLDPWHETCSSWLRLILTTSSNTDNIAVIKSLKIIPLRDPSGGLLASKEVFSWSAPRDLEIEPVYFPDTVIVAEPFSHIVQNSLPIPSGLSLRVVHSQSAVGQERKLLLAKLGVVACPPSTTVSAILERHRRWPEPQWRFSVDTLVSHLINLFWLRSSKDVITDRLIVFSDTRREGRLQKGETSQSFYVKSERLYDTWTLFKDTPGATRYEFVKFISDKYAKAELSTSRPHGLSWMEWLEEIAQIPRRPPLLANVMSPTQLSPILTHVLQRRPADFIPTIQAHWATAYQPTVNKSQVVKDLLSQTAVACERTMPTPLCKTYMPLQLLKAEVERIGLIEHVPFLKLPDVVDDKHDAKWSFLSAFGVGTDTDIDFYLDLLFIAQKLDNAGVLSVKKIVIDLYATIGARCNWNQQPLVSRRLLEGSGVYVPSEERGQRWKQSSACLWNAPPCISVKSALARHYAHDKNISTLFCTYLHIKDAHPNDFLDQLRYFKRTGLESQMRSISSASCAEVYRELHKCQTPPELFNHLKQVMEREKLVFVEPSWHSSSECLWSVDDTISDQVSIGNVYIDLRDFFVNKLGVKTLTTSMLISDLKKKASAKPPLSCETAKTLILKISKMLTAKELDHRLQTKFTELASIKCIPVRRSDGIAVLTTTDDDFAINDNYSLDEVQILRRFLEAAKLTDQYLSNLVTEVSEIKGNSKANAELTLEFQALAYPLFCCAVHFKSETAVGDDESLYSSLLVTQIHEAEEIGTSLVLKQHGRFIKASSSRSQLKIDTTTTPWRIYVPRDGEERRACYKWQLPNAIHQLLGTSDAKAVLVIDKLISEPQDEEMEAMIFKMFDIRPISWIKRPIVPVRTRPSTPIIEPSEVPGISASGSGDNQGLQPISSPAPIGQNISSHTSIFSTPSSESTFPTSMQPTKRLFPPTVSGTSDSQRSSSFGSLNDSLSSAFFGQAGGFSFGSANLRPSGSATPSHRRSASATPTPLFSFNSGGQESVFGGFDSIGTRSASATPAPVFNLGNPTPPHNNSPRRVLPPPLQAQKYRSLLDKIIKRVSGNSQAWNFDDLANSLPETVRTSNGFGKDDIFGVRSEDNMAHDMKIGAAGELFVFETLYKAGLSNFTRNNWLSTIRHEVKVHENYEQMPDKSPDIPVGCRAEPADIVYKDTSAEFVGFLDAQRGNTVGMPDWLLNSRSRPRTYYIEVKTTTQGCDTVFHMSKGQHTRMLEMRKRPFATGSEDVYIVCRVYNLLSKDISMRFYVSPGRDTGDPDPILKFASKGFEVRPVEGNQA